METKPKYKKFLFVKCFVKIEKQPMNVLVKQGSFTNAHTVMVFDLHVTRYKSFGIYPSVAKRFLIFMVHAIHHICIDVQSRDCFIFVIVYAFVILM